MRSQDFMPFRDLGNALGHEGLLGVTSCLKSLRFMEMRVLDALKQEKD